MLTLRPLGSDEQPQSPRGIHLTAVLAAALDGKKPTCFCVNTKNGEGRVDENAPSKMSLMW